jgi:signal transduction histidine kinase
VREDMNFNKYRFADLTVFSLMALAASFISEYAYVKISNPMVYLNFGLLISAIAIVRWGVLGTIPYAFAGIPLLIFRSGDASLPFQISYYILANLAIGFSAFTFRFFDKGKIGQSLPYSIFFLFTAFVSVSLAKGAILAFAGDNFLTSVYSYFLAELFNMVMTMIAFLFVNRFGKGLIVDMRTYIIDMQKENPAHD